jgi:hypothetical protein
LVFHQLGVLLLHYSGMVPNFPYNMRPVPPLHPPQFISLAFWGGVWGIVFVLIERVIARSPGGYWTGAIIFGGGRDGERQQRPANDARQSGSGPPLCPRREDRRAQCCA